MEIALALVIGLFVGTGIAYWLLRKQLAEKEGQRAFELQKQREELEQAHELRLREATQALQADYNRALQAKDAEWEAKMSALPAEHQQPVDAAIAEHSTNEIALSPETLEPAADLGEYEALLEPIADDEEEAEAPSTTPAAVPNEPPVREIAPPEPAIAEPPVPSTPVEVASGTAPEGAAISVAPQPALEEAIAALASSGCVANLYQLKQYLYHPSESVRIALADAIGKIAAGKPVRVEIEQAIQTLGQLSRDASAAVRLAAVESLGKIKSERAISFLQRARHDSDRNVIKAASAAIARFQYYPAKTQLKLPANAPQKSPKKN